MLRGSTAFDALRKLKDEGKIAHWGCSVETVEEAQLAIAQPDCASIQIIFNMLRHKPAAEFLAAAKAANVGTLIRLPFASGLLTGKIDAAYIAGLSDGDHRKFNAAGEFFVSTAALICCISLAVFTQRSFSFARDPASHSSTAFGLTP